MKSFPLPSDPRWCLYLDQKNKPTGEVGHICKGFKHGYAVMGMFSILEEGISWALTKCSECKEELPDDIEPTIGFTRL